MFFFTDGGSTLFVLVLQNKSLPVYSHEVQGFLKTTRGYLTEKLRLIPNTKLVIADNDVLPRGDNKVIPQESLVVWLDGRSESDYATVSELLNKRWKTLDLISVFREAQRTLSVKRRTLKQVPKSYPVNQFAHYNLAYPSVNFPPYQYVQRSGDSINRYPWDSFAVDENLSCLPRLQKTEQKSETSEIYM